MIKRLSLCVATCVATLLLMTGCMTHDVSNKIEAREPLVTAGAEKAQLPADKIDYNPLVVTDKVWAGGRSIRMRRGLPLPANFEGARSVTLVSNKGMNLPDIATFLSQQTGVPVRLVDGAEKANPGPLGAGSGGAPAPAVTPANGQPVAAAPDTASSGSDNGGMKVAYQGPLSNFLDSVASYYGVSWRYDGSAIIVSRYETRTFSIEALSSTADFTDGISGGGGSSGGGGGGGAAGGSSGGASQQTGSLDQSSKFGTKIDYWAELQDTVSTILSGVGTVKAAPSSGTVTVITTPEIMRSVAQYIDQENARATRQVAVTVELFTLQLDNQENISTDLNVIYNKANDFSTGAGLGLGAAGTTNAGQLISTPSISGTDNIFGVSILNPNSRFNGSQALIQALSSIGKVSRVARIPLTTLNNRPVTRRIGQDIAYVANRTSGSGTGSDVVSETITPGTVQEGFSLQVTPRMLGDGRILVQFSLSVIDLVSLANFPETGTPTIQLPTTASRVFVQQALLNNGDSLVLAGYDQDKQSTKNSGFLSPFNILFGGGISSGDTREVLFLTMTPREIDVPRRLPISSAGTLE